MKLKLKLKLRSLSLAFALLLAPLLAPPAALAATNITPTPGSLTIVYTNAAGTIVYSPSATVNNATATQFLAWCHAKYIATAAASTDQGCFNTWANDWFNQTVAGMTASSQAAAAATASAAVVPPAIAPQQ